jgi:flagellar protein FlaG
MYQPPDDSAGLRIYKNLNNHNHTEVIDMTMKAIQDTTASYQGSGAAVEKTTSTQKNSEQAEAAVSVSGAADAQADKIVTPEVASESSIKKAVDEINRKSSNTEAVFGYHEGTHRVTIKILDKDTKEVKREYPAEKTLDMIQKVWEMAGLMVDEKR